MHSFFVFRKIDTCYSFILPHASFLNYIKPTPDTISVHTLL